MKQAKQQLGGQHDPWAELTQDGALAAVPLGQVLARLRVSEREAQAVRQELIAEVNRVCQEPPPHAAQH